MSPESRGERVFVRLGELTGDEEGFEVINWGTHWNGNCCIIMHSEGWHQTIPWLWMQPSSFKNIINNYNFAII